MRDRESERHRERERESARARERERKREGERERGREACRPGPSENAQQKRFVGTRPRESQGGLNGRVSQYLLSDSFWTEKPNCGECLTDPDPPHKTPGIDITSLTRIFEKRTC